MPQHQQYKHGGKISFISRHVCKLDPLELQRELPGVAPFAPLYRKCIYSMRKWTIASRWNPHCKRYFRSNCGLFKERRRQLRNKKYDRIIHPLSRFAMIRQMYMCILWLASFFLDPLMGTFLNHFFENEDNDTDDYVKFCFNVMFLIDIVIQFFIGYTIDRTKEIVLDQRRIARHYLKTYFVFDLLPTICAITIFVINIDFIKTFLQTPENLHTYLLMCQFYVIRCVRLHTTAHYFFNTLSFYNIRESFIRCLTIALLITITVHWLTCLLFVVPTISHHLDYPFAHSWVLRQVVGNKNRGIGSVYIECLLCTVCHFFGAGKGNIEKTGNPLEQLVLSVILMCGVTSHIYIIATILQLFGTINVSETKYEELMYQLNEYMVTKKLPQILRKRLLMYYEYRFQKQFFLENVILNSLSEHLRYEVLLYSCRNLINKVKIFQGAPKEVIGALVAMLKHEIYLPNDHIIKPDVMNEHVYFISFGTVAVYLLNGKEAYHLEDGHHFGEVQIVLHGYGERYVASVVAIEITEVFYLDKRDFWYVVATHPEIADSLEKSALAKMALLKRMSAEAGDNVVDSSDILTELRKGHILDRGRRRV